MHPHPLIVLTHQPYNAETPLALLCQHDLTPNEQFFVRNHGDVPTIDPRTHRIAIGGDVRTAMSIGVDELRDRFPNHTITATLACAGNRRREFSRIATVPTKLPWGPGAIGNATWTGVRLRDVLATAGVAPDARHVAFGGVDNAETPQRPEPFGGSIPIGKALTPEVVLAYAMNGARLAPEHGFPLRVVVPGFIGARSVKWLASITVQREPSTSFFHRVDYTLAGEPLGALQLNSAICQPADNEAGAATTILVEGYAIGGGGRPVERVEVSCDDGQTWRAARLVAPVGDPFTWQRWHVTLAVPAGSDQIVVRACDGASADQPPRLATAWNPKGYMNNAWHRVNIRR
jgi:sulfite oxidase